MFTIDTPLLMLILVVAPTFGLIGVMHMTSSLYDTLPYRRGLMELPLYAYLYRRADGDTDLPDRSLTKTLLGLGFLYLTILVTLAPVANKLLGIIAWMFTIGAAQAFYVSFYLACIATVVCSLLKVAKGLCTRDRKRVRLLPIAVLGIIFGGSVLVAMAPGIRLTVWHTSTSVSSGLFCCVFSGAILYLLAEKEEETGEGGVGLKILSVFLIFLSVGSLASILS